MYTDGKSSSQLASDGGSCPAPNDQSWLYYGMISTQEKKRGGRVDVETIEKLGISALPPRSFWTQV